MTSVDAPASHEPSARSLGAARDETAPRGTRTSGSRGTVVQVVQSLGKGGLESMSVNLAVGMRDAGLRSVLVGLDEGGVLEQRLDDEQIEWHVLGDVHYASPRTHWRLARLFRRLRADVVHTHHLPALLNTVLAARLAGVRRVVHTEHAYQYLEPAPGYRKTLRTLSRFTQKFVVVGEQLIDYYAREVGVSRERLCAIPNGVDTDAYAPALDRATLRRDLGLPDGFLVGAVSRLAHVKNYPMLLRAMAALRRDGVPGRLAILGDGDERDALESQARELGIADAVTFLGWRTDVAQVLRSFDVLALTSWTEGLPLVILEAMASGVPIVSTEVGDVPRVLRGGALGTIVSVDDDAALARALATLFHDDALRARFATQARAEVVERYSQTAMVSQYIEAYGLPASASKPAARR